MIDLTPLEVRKKKGDFRRAMRGYDPALVDDFLDLVADRLDELVRQNLQLSERVTRQDQQVADYRERERALTEALVTAQEMREEIRRQTAQEADLARRSAEQEITQMRSTAQQEASRLRAEAQQETTQLRARVQQEVSDLRTAVRQEREREEESLRVLRARQQQFVTAYRAFLEQELNELGGITRALGLSAAPAAAVPSGPAAAHVAARAVAPDVSDAGQPVSFVTIAEAHEEFVLEQVEPFEPEPFEPEAVDDPVEDAFDDPFEDPLDSAQPVFGDDVDSPFAAGRSALDDASHGAMSDAIDDEVTSLSAGTPAADDPLDLYDVLAASGGDAGVPGPIGFGSTVAPPQQDWTVPGIDLAPDPADIRDSEPGDAATFEDVPANRDMFGPESPSMSDDAAAGDHVATNTDVGSAGDDSVADAGLLADDDLLLDDEPDEEVDLLLRNAAAAGYALEDLDSSEELLLEEELGTEGEGSGWLPDLLEDDDGGRR